MNLYSTAKMSRYSVDGTGRDSYINTNNGGIYRRFNHRISSIFESGSFKSKHNTRVFVPEITSKTVWYRNDGTGRDTYALKEDLILPRRKNYLSSLRQYDFNPEKEQSRSLSKKLTRPQERSVKRLSCPKSKEDPYSTLRRSFRVSLDHSWRKGE